MHDLYIWLDTTAQAVTLGGIPFAAFYACAKPYIRNMLLLKSDYVGAHCCKNFELLCGQDEIKAFLASEDLRFGDFCFVDFADGANPDALTPEQVAELLYVAHMWSPLRGIAFPPLRNAFIYLSHDDAHTLKLFYTNPAAARDVLLRLVQFSLSQSGGAPMSAFPAPTADALMELLQTGVLVRAVDGAHIRLTEVGKTEDMDALWNRKNILAAPVRTLSLSSEGWTIV